jgi:hypothetical protein
MSPADASSPVTVTQNHAVGHLLGLGAINVASTVRDPSGNRSVGVSSLVVGDNVPPFLQTCLPEVTLGFDTNC